MSPDGSFIEEVPAAETTTLFTYWPQNEVDLVTSPDSIGSDVPREVSITHFDKWHPQLSPTCWTSLAAILNQITRVRLVLLLSCYIVIVSDLKNKGRKLCKVKFILSLFLLVSEL